MAVDTSAIYALARCMRERSEEIREEAEELARRVEAVPWTGLAADAMRRVTRDHLGRLLSCALAHDEAADSLDRHAREVDHAKQVLAAWGGGLGHSLELGLHRGAEVLVACSRGDVGGIVGRELAHLAGR